MDLKSLGTDVNIYELEEDEEFIPAPQSLLT